MLLDSTRPIGENLNTRDGRPKTTSTGDLFQCHSGRAECWFVLRATYARELKVQEQMREQGFRTFIPMMWKENKLVPAVTGLVFVQSTRETIDRFIHGFGDDRPVNYYWDRAANRPLRVPDKAMDDFITIASSMKTDLIYLTEITDKLREGQRVLVKDGPFKGVEGKVVRIRKSRRILVELPGMFAVAATYVPALNLEII